jgi:hypothetical protein
MMERLFRFALIVALGSAAIGCDDESREDLNTFAESVGIETRQLVLALRNTGATVEVVETVPPSQSLFSTQTTRITVNGAEVFVFEFATIAETDAAVARLPSILAVTTFPVGPHFYRGNRIIVLYVGTDSAITAQLERLLGPPIA